MVIESRFQKNLGTFSEIELQNIRTKSICVIGWVGWKRDYGAGKFGVGKLTLIDHDV